MEVYSDAWPQFTDLLAMAKPLEGTLRVYTSVYDPRVVVADRVVYTLQSISVEALAAKKEWRGGKMCRAATPEFAAAVEEDLLEIVREVWEAGGFVALKFAQEKFGERLLKAINAGLLRLDALTLTVRITELGAKALGI